MNQAPNGAITSIKELQDLAGTEVWCSSPTYGCSSRSIRLTGDVGITTHADQSTYAWFEYCDNDYAKISSLLDMNIPANGYNDWYLFRSLADAKAYAKTKADV